MLQQKFFDKLKHNLDWFFNKNTLFSCNDFTENDFTLQGTLLLPEHKLPLKTFLHKIKLIEDPHEKEQKYLDLDFYNKVENNWIKSIKYIYQHYNEAEKHKETLPKDSILDYENKLFVFRADVSQKIDNVSDLIAECSARYIMTKVNQKHIYR